MSEYVDWQKKLSDDFDVDGYMMPNESAKDFHAKFCKAKADGMRLAAEHCSDPDYAPTADRWELANCFDNEADKLHPTE